VSNDTSAVVAAGRFLHVEGEKFYVRGVTYGTFRPFAPTTRHVRESAPSGSPRGQSRSRLL
jgi:hypothetical protein